MNTFLLDTSYVFALGTADDINHELTLKHWQSLSKGLPRLVTTSYVFDEMVTFFNSRNRHAKAVEIGNTQNSLEGSGETFGSRPCCADR